MRVNQTAGGPARRTAGLRMPGVTGVARAWVRRALLSLLLALVAVLLSGCWDHVPLEERAFATNLAIDTRQDGEPGVEVTLRAIDPAAASGGGGDGGGQAGQATPLILTDAGTNIQDGLRVLRASIARRPSFDHVRTLVVGRSAAEQDMEPIIAWALRQPQVRPFVAVVIAQNRGQELLLSGLALEPIHAEATDDLLRQASLTGLGFRLNIVEFARALLNDKLDPIAPVIGLKTPVGNTGMPTPSGPAAQQLRVVGMAVFRGTRLVSVMDSQASRGLGLAAGRSRVLLTVEAENPRGQPEQMGFRVLNTSTKLQPRWTGSELEISLNIHLEGEVQETERMENVSKDIAEIERAVADTVRNDVMTAVAQLQSLRSDPLGVERELYRVNPSVWRQLQARWDEIYSGAAVEVTVDVIARDIGLGR